MTKAITKEQFQAVQLGWASVLTHPELGAAMQEMAHTEAKLSDGGDLASLMQAKGVVLPQNVKASLQHAANSPMALRLCVVFDPDFAGDPLSGTVCIGIRNPFTLS